MDLLDISFWCGTEESLARYLDGIKRMNAANVGGPEKNSYHGDMAPERRNTPRLFSLQGNVGVISISGALNNTDSWMNEFMGATGYPEIRAALVYAAKDPDVKSIMLDIKSGGGTVSGVTDTADLIAMIDKQVKPVSAYSDGMIASAAYWLGSSARTLDIGKVTEIGSIGVLTVHQDLSKMYAEMGVTNTVLRAGKYKALGNKFEPLSEAAKEEIQAQLDQMYSMFAQHVADARGVPYSVADQKMGQGRVFVGQSGVDVGLADSVASFDSVMSRLQGEIALSEKSGKYGANLQKGYPLKNALTQQEVAALALSVGANVQSITPFEASETAKAASEALEALAAAGAKEAEDAVAEKAPAEVVAVAAGAAAEKAPVNDGVVAMLQAQLAEANDKALKAHVELAMAKAESAAGAKSADLMRPLIQANVGDLRVYLGGSREGVDALSDTDLLAEQSSLNTQFKTKFKSGGVAVSSAATGEKSQEVAHNHMARIHATRNSKK